MSNQEIKNCEELMKKSLSAFSQELMGIRTGRASPGLLDGIIVETYGQKMKMVQIATVNVADSTTLNVSPYDKSSIGSIERAILDANLGLSASSNGNTILVKISKMSEETRREWVKAINDISERYKIAVRNIRRDGMSNIKDMEKEKIISQDEKKRLEAELQKITDLYISKIEESADKKSEEIMEV